MKENKAKNIHINIINPELRYFVILGMQIESNQNNFFLKSLLRFRLMKINPMIGFHLEEP